MLSWLLVCLVTSSHTGVVGLVVPGASRSPAQEAAAASPEPLRRHRGKHDPDRRRGEEMPDCVAKVG